MINDVTFKVTKAAKIDIGSLQFHEPEEKVRELGEPSYRARQITDWLYQKRVSSFDEMTDLPQEFRSRLAEHFDFSKSDIVRVLGSEDTTRKFLLRLNDESLIETVLIPASPALYGSRSDRRTICVSTQVGCASGCKFCASGLEGFSRNLRANEIVDQITAVERASGDKIDNIVFMGMGEPLANFDNLLRAIQIINAPWGLAIAPAGFGRFSGNLLVGNFGDGRINAYRRTGSGWSYDGTLHDRRGHTIVVNGLWALAFGNGGLAGAADTLYFTSGPHDWRGVTELGVHGLLGSITTA